MGSSGLWLEDLRTTHCPGLVVILRPLHFSMPLMATCGSARARVYCGYTTGGSTDSPQPTASPVTWYKESSKIAKALFGPAQRMGSTAFVNTPFQPFRETRVSQMRRPHWYKLLRMEAFGLARRKDWSAGRLAVLLYIGTQAH